ncbi:MAG: substrate-binding domain-containing protein [Magnetospiraceae bacterium]
MKAKNILPRLVVLAIAGIVAANILLPGDSSTPPPSSSPTPDPTPTQQMADLVIVSGSENEALEPVIMDWANANKVSIAIKYLGSVDISLALESGKSIPYDAVWPANSLWIELGDSQRVVKHEKSIFRLFS